MSWRKSALLASAFLAWAACDEFEGIVDADLPLAQSDAGISFTRFQLKDGSVLDPNAPVAWGTLDVTTQVSVNRTNPLTGPIKARIYFDGALNHEETIQPQQQGNFQHVFTRNLITDALDPTTRLAKYFNEPHVFKAELVNERNEVVASKEQAIQFRNPDLVNVATTYNALATANDLDGNRWVRGGFKVDVESALFTRGRQVTSIEADIAGTKFSAPHAAGVAQFIIDGQRTTPNGIAGLTLGPQDVQVTVNTNQGPIRTALDVRVDNGGPTANGAAVVRPTNGWLRARSTVADLVPDADEIDDEGVGKVQLQLQYAQAGSTTFQVATDPRQLGETSSNGQITIKVIARDGLGNETELPGGGNVGRDSTRAVVTITAVPVDSVLTTTASATVQLAVTDALSGVPGQNPLRATIERAAPGVTGQAACAFGRYDAADSVPCRASPAGTSLSIPTAAGFWKLHAKGVDIAGNYSQPVTRVFLRDGALPTITNQTVTLLANGNAQFTFLGADDASIARSVAYYRGPYSTGTIALNTADYTSVTAWGSAASPVQITFSSLPITSFQVVNAAHAPTGVPAPILNYIVEAIDHARNPVLADIPVLGALLAGADARTKGVETLRLASTPTVVCNGNPAAPPCPAGTPKLQQVLIEARLVEGAPSSPVPFGQAYVWVRDPVLGRFVLGGLSTQPTLRTEGARHTQVFDLPVLRQALRPQDQAVVLTGARAPDGGLLISAPWFVRIIDGS